MIRVGPDGGPVAFMFRPEKLIMAIVNAAITGGGAGAVNGSQPPFLPNFLHYHPCIFYGALMCFCHFCPDCETNYLCFCTLQPPPPTDTPSS